MPLVFFAVAQQVAVKLLDVIFGDGDVLPGMEDGFHDLGITGDFLLIASVELFNFQVGKQSLNLSVGELTAFNAS